MAGDMCAGTCRLEHDGVIPFDGCVHACGAWGILSLVWTRLKAGKRLSEPSEDSSRSPRRIALGGEGNVTKQDN